MDRRVTDREVYPAVWITAAALGAAFLIWYVPLGRPAFPACLLLTRWHIYCPACGGTRAAAALAGGQWLRALYWNPAVPFGALSATAYLGSQTLRRLRGGRGWALRYDRRWLWALLGILAANCIARNALWFGFGRAL